MIRIGFSTQRRNPVSRLIRAFTGSKASHAWLLVRDEAFATDLVMEAHETGYRLVPLRSFARRNSIVGVFDPQHPLEAGLREAAQWLGSAYDFLGLVGSAWVLLGRWLRRRWRNPFRSTRALFCSEAVVRVLRTAGFPGADKLDPEATTPQDLMDFLRAKGLPTVELPELKRQRTRTPTTLLQP